MHLVSSLLVISALFLFQIAQVTLTKAVSERYFAHQATVKIRSHLSYCKRF